jgi:hypothetical protein
MASSANNAYNNINSFLEFMIDDNLGEIGIEWVNWITEINYFLSMNVNALNCYKNYIKNNIKNNNDRVFPEFNHLIKIINDINGNVHARGQPKEFQFGYDLWGYTHH